MKLAPEELAFLQGIPVFGGLAEASIERIASRLKSHDIAEGTAVVTEGDLGREMFIVRSGQVEVMKDVGAGAQTRLALLKPGACFGEMSLIDIQPRSAGVRAVTASKILSLAFEELARVWKEEPQTYTLIVMNIAREMSRRLRRADVLIASIYRVVAGLDLEV